MNVRLSAVALLTGLAFAAPVHAEVDLLSPEPFVDAHETETAALIAVDLAMLQGAASFTPSEAAQPVSVADASNSNRVELRSEPAAPADLVSATPAEKYEEGSLAPELFLDLYEDETFAWIAADLAPALELTTGAIANDSAGTAPLPEGQLIIQSLTDDALPFEEYLLP
ncbi:hypothetical protein KBI52_11295 [Microvirga sp. HBU67558]|uniref:hypothetical protein n=1 Tax=Microvirga TaxID=186650 RepID=UPI001B37509C|nr:MULTISPECIES: hypothetical protein [unclassified Microvirga]MBQ0820792.1 hypothetical protein [Microvirga sp. HBU67558]